MKILQKLFLFALVWGNTLNALDMKWQVTLPVSDVDGDDVLVAADGSAAVLEDDFIFWYSSLGSLQSTINLVTEVGAAYGEFELIIATKGYLLVIDQNWGNSSQSRLIIFSLSGGSLTHEVVVGSTMDDDRISLPVSNFISVVNGEVLTVYSLPDASGGSSSSGLSMVPNNAVVIPTSYQGNVEIMLETSNDLVEWTQALPGTYNPATSPRFFRVRAESAE